MSIFQPIISAELVETKVRDQLKLWFPTYLAEIGRQLSVDAPPAPRSYVILDDVQKYSQDQLPCCIVMCPGILTSPTRKGGGVYEATWSVGVMVCCVANTYENSRKLAQRYGAAVRGIMTQRGSVGGFASETVWVDEGYDDMPSTDRLNMQGARLMFGITVDSVVTANAGPTTIDVPSTEPWADDPLVVSIDVQVTEET